MRTASLPEELVLLAYDDAGDRRIGGTELSYGLGGAILLELALAGRVGVTDGRLVVTDPTPPGDPVLDAALARIGAEDRPRRAKVWVERLGKGAADVVLNELVAAGVLRREEGRVLLVFPRTSYPAAHGVEPPAETDARRRLHAAVTATGPVPDRTAALAALVGAVGLDRKVFADLPRRQVKARLAEIGAGAWAAEAVRKAIADVQAAVMAATFAATTAATTASSS